LQTEDFRDANSPRPSEASASPARRREPPGANPARAAADNAGVSNRRQRVVTADQWGKPERDAAGAPICRWCRGPVAPPRRTFCGDACVHEWKIRSSPWYVRREVKKRDKGICRLCGLNVVKAHREWTRGKPPVTDRAARKRWRAARPRWEADHIVPVADGGGECGLDNYRLLCRPCHLRVTLEWRARRTA
jgi:5-methylcytosine-specific restriction enzyme A